MRTHRSLPLMTALLLLALASGCPSKSPAHPERRVVAPQENYTAPLLTAERSVRAAALYYKQGGGGGVSPVMIRVGPNEEKIPEVGVLEQWTGGTGGQMKSSVWVAAFIATSALGRELIDYRFSASTRGFVDGPSAGALFTAAMMAAITGETVNPQVTMTGTVNPDGTVGPVGGIPDKYLGAIAQGYKVLGYPVGQKVQTDHAGNLVDLEELASTRGAQAFPIATIYDAYKLLTGKAFPTRFIVQRPGMAIPAEAGAALRQAANTWGGIFGKFQGMTAQRKIGNDETIRRFQIAAKFLESGKQQFGKGLNAAGYEFASRAASFSFTTFHQQDFIIQLKAAIEAKATAPLLQKALLLHQGSVDSKKMFDKIRGLAQPQTVDQAISQVAAYSLAIETLAYMQGAESIIRGLVPAMAQGQVTDPMLRQLNRSLDYMGVAQIKAMKAGHVVGMAYRQGAPFALSTDRAKAIASQFSSMAAANLEYADSVIIKPLAEAQKIPLPQMQVLLPNYLVASFSKNVAMYVSNLLNKGTWQWSLAELGAAISSYLGSSMLMTKLYSVGAFASMGGNVEKVSHEEALLAMLRSVEVNARQSAARAQKAIGFVPTMARYYYEVGDAMRQSGQSMQVKALEMYWRSSMLSQLAVMMARQ